jgi:hypothetical protein
MLAVAHGSAPAHALLRGGNSDNDMPGASGNLSSTEGSRAVVSARSRQLVREGSDRRCGCNSGDASNGHAARAGF